MSDHSAIEWTDATWNPTTGCTKISPGCAHCYIERTPAFRIAGRKFVDGDIPVLLHADRLEQPLHWRRPRRVFVNSLSDLFHEDVPDAFILRVLDVIRRCPQHTFQLLSKRAGRMRALMSVLQFDPRGAGRMFLAEAPSLNRLGQPISFAPLMKNLWLGVSVENRRSQDERIWQLLRTPAAVRFISAEPLLGALDLARVGHDEECGGALNALTGEFWIEDWHDNIGTTRSRHVVGSGEKLDWVIDGGESGPGARPSHPDWFRRLRDQCQAAGARYFHKQNGEWRGAIEGDVYNTLHGRAGKPPAFIIDALGAVHCTTAACGQKDTAVVLRVGKKAAGRLLDGREWNEFPEART